MLLPHPSASEAWRRAHAAAAIPGVRLQALASVDDADRIVRVMEATWGEAPPRDLIRALAGSGNVPIGAFDGADLVGFALGWAADDPEDGLHVYSHMLAALPDRRHRGVGFALKLAQRALALDQGFSLMRWTFDPLVPRNAHLNLHKLGAIADRFYHDYYGEMTDAINRGDRSDRLVIRWDLDRTPGPPPRLLGGEPVALRSVGTPDAPSPERLQEFPDDAAAVAVQIPRDYGALRGSDPALATAWRDAVGDVLAECFARGLRAIAFDADFEGGRPTYLLGDAKSMRAETVLP